MSEIRFTNELTLQVLANRREYLEFRLHMPLFVWLMHPALDGLDHHEVTPVFYIDDQPPVSYLAQERLLRSATEAACEEAWEIYSDLVESGIPFNSARQVLPMNLMAWGTATFTETQIKDFVANHRTSPIKELALVAHGYERALTDGDN